VLYVNEGSELKRNWACPSCFLVFSRKWNLDRHIKLMHQGSHNSLNVNHIPNNKRNEKQTSNYGAFQPMSFDLKEIYDFAELTNKMAHSNMLFNQINSLQREVSSLQQQLTLSNRSLDDLLSRNWPLSKRSIQGLSGYLCEKCGSFSVKPIFDIGYDMTMQSRHRCNEPEYKRNYLIQQIPIGIQNADAWSGQLLTYCVNNYTFIGRNLAVTDLTKSFKSFEHELNSEIAYQILGIPERFYLHSLKSSVNVNWIDKAIKNIDKKTPLSDSEIIDFVTRIKSTYGIFEIPMGRTVRLISFILTD
jgi:hypothetical protein